VSRTALFGADENPRVKGVQHGAVALEKGDGLGLVSLRQIDIQASRRVQYCLLNGGIDPAVAVEDS
jgi:hypothetical protein